MIKMPKVLVNYQVTITFEMDAHKKIKDFGNDNIVDAVCEEANDKLNYALYKLPDEITCDIGNISIVDKNTGEIYYDG